MPVFIRPARVEITEGGSYGGVLVAAVAAGAGSSIAAAIALIEEVLLWVLVGGAVAVVAFAVVVARLVIRGRPEHPLAQVARERTRRELAASRRQPALMRTPVHVITDARAPARSTQAGTRGQLR